ncbi:STAS domain-containing protein [Actinoplanes sp. NPDC048967]|uniref:STAS domain-containing protein n=1 Tax=Actinoplanes sp. NPDC048967 TaxID=3155269 RepID=UPI00340921C3
MPEHTIPETTVVVTEALEGTAVQLWGDTIAAAVGLEPALLVIDLHDSPSIDASAVVMLLQTHRSMVCADGRLLVRGAAPRVRRMLGLARVDRVLDIEDRAAGEPAVPTVRR